MPDLSKENDNYVKINKNYVNSIRIFFRLSINDQFFRQISELNLDNYVN